MLKQDGRAAAMRRDNGWMSLDTDHHHHSSSSSTAPSRHQSQKYYQSDRMHVHVEIGHDGSIEMKQFSRHIYKEPQLLSLANELAATMRDRQLAARGVHTLFRAPVDQDANIRRQHAKRMRSGIPHPSGPLWPKGSPQPASCKRPPNQCESTISSQEGSLTSKDLQALNSRAASVHNAKRRVYQDAYSILHPVDMEKARRRFGHCFWDKLTSGSKHTLASVAKLYSNMASEADLSDLKAADCAGRNFHVPEVVCQSGCSKCFRQRELMHWPNGLTLYFDLNLYTYEEIVQLLDHYGAMRRRDLDSIDSAAGPFSISQQSKVAIKANQQMKVTDEAEGAQDLLMAAKPAINCSTEPVSTASETDDAAVHGTARKGEEVSQEGVFRTGIADPATPSCNSERSPQNHSSTSKETASGPSLTGDARTCKLTTAEESSDTSADMHPDSPAHPKVAKQLPSTEPQKMPSPQVAGISEEALHDALRNMRPVENPKASKTTQSSSFIIPQLRPVRKTRRTKTSPDRQTSPWAHIKLRSAKILRQIKQTATN